MDMEHLDIGNYGQEVEEFLERVREQKTSFSEANKQLTALTQGNLSNADLNTLRDILYDLLQPKKATRTDIIESIIVEGILPASLIAMRSNIAPHTSIDSESTSKDIHGITIDANEHTQSLKDKLYGGWSSIFPVLIEQYGEKEGSERQLSREILEERVNSSIIIVCKAGDIRIDFEIGEEVSLEDGAIIPPDQILYVIVPEDLISSEPALKKIKEKIISVAKKEAQILTIRKRSTDPLPLTIDVPDYEQALINISKKIGEKIFVHAVRLPTK